MFKKVIAGVLSAVMCASTLLYDAPLGRGNTAREGEQVPAASRDAQPDLGLIGSNSLARYLSKQGAEQAVSQPAAQPLKASAADAVFAVTNLDFDRETGIIQVTSTQSEAAKLLVSFIDEENPANVYSVEYDVPAGEYVHSAFSADIAQLPEYFTVSARLTGRAGLPLCKAFEIKTYNREMQAIIEKEVADFAPEQVVNLDEDETTNFIVLSEDTVRAETTEEYNILVSADYDQNIYVFDHIDESIRSLEKGQYFYIQPTDDDIISTDIQEIVIDGDTATITGSGEIDDMFDFIKIEVDTAQMIETEGASEPDGSEAAIPEAEEQEEAESGRSYRGVNAQVIDNQEEYNKRLEELKAIDPDLELTQQKFNFTAKREFKKGAVTITPAFAIDATIKWNVYKSFGYVNVFLAAEIKASLTLTGSVSAKTPTSKNNSNENNGSGDGGTNNGGTNNGGTDNGGTESSGSGDSGSEGDDSGDDDEDTDELPDDAQSDPAKDKTPKHLIKVPLATVGAAEICAFIDIGLTLGFEGKLTVEKTFTKGFTYDSDDGFEKIDFDTTPVIGSASMKVSLTLDVKVGFELSALKGLVTASVAGGFKATASAQLTASTGTVDNKTYNPTGTNVFKADPDTDEDCIHADETCIKVEITFKVYVELKLSVGFKFDDDSGFFKKQLNKLRFDISLSYETDEVFGHRMPKYVLFCSYNKSGVYAGWNFNIYRVEHGQKVECPHKAYKLTFLINFVNVPAGTTSELLVSGNRYSLSPVSQSRLKLYAIPSTSAYSYQINVNGSRAIADTVLIKDSCKTVRHTVSWPSDGKGGPDVDTGTPEDGPAIVTEPIQTAPIEEPNFDYSPYMPEANLISSGDEQYDLGPYISGMFSNDGTFTVIGYGDMYENASIPYEVRIKIRRIVFNDQDPEEGLFINNIANSLFYGAANLEVVYMPERITAIGNSAFQGCKNLKWLRYNGGSDTTTTFVLPKTLKTIGNSAFNGCSSAAFGDLTIPESVTSIGGGAFGYCEKITSVTISDKNELKLGENVFVSCTAMKEAYLGKNVRCMDDDWAYWFHSCDALEKLTVPVFNVGIKKENWMLQDLFNGGASVPASLTDVTVLSGAVIPQSYFYGLPQLKRITYPDNITDIGQGAFQGCTGAEALPLPKTLKTIGNSAFYECSSAAFGDLTIPESVTSIGGGAFGFCEKITSVTISDKNELKLGENVFVSCTAMKEAYLGKNVRCMDDDWAYWFHSCDALEKLTVPVFNVGIKKENWMLQDLFYGGGSVPATLTDVTVLTGTVIPASYFYGLPQLKRITYPNNITDIGQSAFQGCTGAEALPLPKTLKTIGNSAFYECSSAAFGDLTIPESVTSIGGGAFGFCEKITSVTISDKNELKLGENVFVSCTAMKEAYLGKNVRCMDDDWAYWFHSCDALEKLTVPVFNVGIKKENWMLQDLFYGGGSVPATLTDVTVLTGTVIPAGYFYGLPQLKRITYPNHITDIGQSAFQGCTGAEALPLPKTLKTIGNSAFYECSSAAFGDLTIPESVTSIGGGAFGYCKKITSVTISDKNELKLGENVFVSCTAMKEAYLGKNVRCMDDDWAYWFHSCDALEKLTVPVFNVGLKKENWMLQDLFNGGASVPASLTDVTVLTGTVIPQSYFYGLPQIKSVTFSDELENVETNAFCNCSALEEAYLIGDDSDWDKVNIVETGNQPLLDIVRKSRPIVILSDLHDVTAEKGQTAEFLICAAGKYELTYQWQYSADGGSSWQTCTDSNTNQLSFAATQDGYLFRCEISDEYGHSVTSAKARLTVTEKQATGKQDPRTLPGYKPGDVNGDNCIDVSDAVLVARFAVGDISARVKDIGVINGDVNGDGNTDIQDLTLILMFIVKRIRVFPVDAV